MNLVAIAICGALAGQPATQTFDVQTASPSPNRFDDPDYVLKMAQSDPQPHLRLLAATLLRSQPHLVRLMESKDPEIRVRAMRSLTDQAALARIVRGDPDPRVRRIAVRRCHDEQLLRQVALLDEDVEVGRSAVRQIHDQPALKVIAAHARSPETRRLASERVVAAEKSAEALVEAERRFQEWRAEAERRAKESREIDEIRALDAVGRADRVTATSPSRRLAILDALKDEATLHELARRPPGSWGREDAVRSLHDQERLADLALRGLDAPLRRLAAARISDPAVALRLVGETQDPDVRWMLSRVVEHHRELAAAAILRASLVLPEKALPALAAECRPGKPRGPAPAPPGEREDELLARARGAGLVADRVAAIRRLTDQDALAALAGSDPDPGVRAAAAATLTHTHLIQQVLEHEADDTVRAAAVTRLTDAPTLARLARADPSPRVRRAALCNSREPTVWNERARADEDPTIRATARRVLEAAP